MKLTGFKIISKNPFDPMLLAWGHFGTKTHHVTGGVTLRHYLW